MEKKYWIRINDENKGPYSMNEIIASKYNEENFVWYEGLENWIQLKDDTQFKKLKKNNANKSLRKKLFLLYLFISIFGIFLFILTNTTISSISPKLKTDYGNDWYTQSIIEDKNPTLIINFLSVFLIVLGGALFFSIKKRGIIIISSLVFSLFVIFMYVKSKSINTYISNLGEKDAPGIQKSMDDLRKTLEETSNEINNPQPIISKKYVIVYLKTVDNTGSGYDENGIYQAFLPVEKDNVTSVSEYDFFDETEKAKLEDMVVSKYLNSINAKVNNGRIISKRTYVFDTYIEASKKRNEFLME